MGNIVTILRPHNHPPDYANVEKEILKRNIIDNAAAQGLSTTLDLTGIISSLPNSLASKMPTLDCMKRAIRRRQNISVQSNRSMEGPLPTSTGTDYYSSISENATSGSMDIFINNHQHHNLHNPLFDAKELQSSLYDDSSNNATTSNFPLIFEQPSNDETPNIK
uniref:Uncharacterized protein n=1 Tax=Panagrolaimus superbus TaxID=310955 RepID=A0A914Y497_9BILA